MGNDLGRLNLPARLADDPNTLQLSDQEIGPKMCEKVCAYLEKDRKVSVIYMSWNQIGDAGALAIAKLLCVSRTIRILDLGSNGIRNSGLHIIAVAIENNEGVALEELHLQNNYIEDKGALALLRSLWDNTTVLVVDLSENRLSEQVLRQTQQISQRPALVSIASHRIDEAAEAQAAAAAAAVAEEAAEEAVGLQAEAEAGVGSCAAADPRQPKQPIGGQAGDQAGDQQPVGSAPSRKQGRQREEWLGKAASKGVAGQEKPLCKLIKNGMECLFLDDPAHTKRYFHPAKATQTPPVAPVPATTGGVAHKEPATRARAALIRQREKARAQAEMEAKAEAETRKRERAKRKKAEAREREREREKAKEEAEAKKHERWKRAKAEEATKREKAEAEARKRERAKRKKAEAEAREREEAEGAASTPHGKSLLAHIRSLLETPEDADEETTQRANENFAKFQHQSVRFRKGQCNAMTYYLLILEVFPPHSVSRCIKLLVGALNPFPDKRRQLYTLHQEFGSHASEATAHTAQHGPGQEQQQQQQQQYEPRRAETKGNSRVKAREQAKRKKAEEAEAREREREREEAKAEAEARKREKAEAEARERERAKREKAQAQVEVEAKAEARKLERAEAEARVEQIKRKKAQEEEAREREREKTQAKAKARERQRVKQEKDNAKAAELDRVKAEARKREKAEAEARERERAKREKAQAQVEVEAKAEARKLERAEAEARVEQIKRKKAQEEEAREREREKTQAKAKARERQRVKQEKDNAKAAELDRVKAEARKREKAQTEARERERAKQEKAEVRAASPVKSVAAGGTSALRKMFEAKAAQHRTMASEGNSGRVRRKKSPRGGSLGDRQKPRPVQPPQSTADAAACGEESSDSSPWSSDWDGEDSDEWTESEDEGEEQDDEPVDQEWLDQVQRHRAEQRQNQGSEYYSVEASASHALEQMSVKELQRVLSEREISFKDCVEKSELIAKISCADKASSSHQEPTLGPGLDSGGSDETADAKMPVKEDSEQEELEKKRRKKRLEREKAKKAKRKAKDLAKRQKARVKLLRKEEAALKKEQDEVHSLQRVVSEDVERWKSTCAERGLKAKGSKAGAAAKKKSAWDNMGAASGGRSQDGWGERKVKKVKAPDDIAEMLLSLHTIFPRMEPDHGAWPFAEPLRGLSRKSPKWNGVVRKAYLKAMLVVHPDKLPHGVGPDRLARANLIFTALRAAFALNSK